MTEAAPQAVEPQHGGTARYGRWAAHGERWAGRLSGRARTAGAIFRECVLTFMMVMVDTEPEQFEEFVAEARSVAQRDDVSD